MHLCRTVILGLAMMASAALAESVSGTLERIVENPRSGDPLGEFVELRCAHPAAPGNPGDYEGVLLVSDVLDLIGIARFLGNQVRVDITGGAASSVLASYRRALRVSRLTVSGQDITSLVPGKERLMAQARTAADAYIQKNLSPSLKYQLQAVYVDGLYATVTAFGFGDPRLPCQLRYDGVSGQITPHQQGAGNAGTGKLAH
jgi:hypothetical protein